MSIKRNSNSYTNRITFSVCAISTQMPIISVVYVAESGDYCDYCRFIELSIREFCAQHSKLFMICRELFFFCFQTGIRPNLIGWNRISTVKWTTEFNNDITALPSLSHISWWQVKNCDIVNHAFRPCSISHFIIPKWKFGLDVFKCGQISTAQRDGKAW